MPAPLRRRSPTAVDSSAPGRLLLRRLLHEHAMLLREVVELRALRDLAYHDPLTGLRNVRFLRGRLDEELQRSGARAAGSPGGALVMLDVEGFTRLNQRFGRAAGDRTLIWLGRELAAAVRLSDVCCRTGADEFALILPETDRAGAETTMFRLIHAAAEARGERWLPLSLQAGLATWPADGSDAAGLLAVAGRALAADRRRARAGRPRLRLVP